MFYLVQRIHESIDLNGGKINFYDYMNFCLYGPGDGFYNNTELKFTLIGGAFFTLPQYSKFFAYFVAFRLNIFYRKNISMGLLEVGAGTGRFLLDVLTYLYNFGTVVETIIIVEYSYHLQKLQYDMFRHTYFYNSITWVRRIPYGYKGIMLCNEILDAIPVHSYVTHYNMLYERYVGCVGNTLNWVLVKKREYCYNGVIKKGVKTCNNIYFSEICFVINNFLLFLTRGVDLTYIYFFDYGYCNDSICSNKGTLRCYYKNRSYNNPFLFIGSQDITAHVDFTFFLSVCKMNNIIHKDFMSFCNFFTPELLYYLVKSCDVSKICRYKISDELNLLLSSDKMGDVFKVLVVMKL